MMWEQVLEGEDKVFSVFEINGDYCGSLNCRIRTLIHLK